MQYRMFKKLNRVAMEFSTLRIHTYAAITVMLWAGSCEMRESSGPVIPRTRHVVVIGVDAMSPDGIINAETPIMDALMREGAYTLNARGVLPTSSSTNWASMVSGAGPEQHGVTSNDWERDDFNIPPLLTGTEDIFPTIFGVSRQQRPDMEIGAIYTWKGFGRLIERSSLSFDATEPTDQATLERAKTYLKEKRPDFLFIHFDNVDHVGHEKGHRTPDYYAAVSEVDKQIGQVIQSTKEAGIFDETVFIISADHGGIGYGHGGETLDEIEIPFILYGKGTKQGYIIKTPVYTYDNAATVASLLGVKQPYAWIGKPVQTAFEGFPEPETDNRKVLIPGPVIYPKPHLYDPAGGLYVDKHPKVEIHAQNNAEIRYTLDGSVPNRKSDLYSEPFELDKTTVVMAKSFIGNQNESNTSTAYYRLVKGNSKNGIHYTYYEGESWKFLPVFENLTALDKGTTYEFRINDINQRKYQFGIRFRAFLEIETAGEYRFYLNSDDGSKLYIDGKLIVDNDGGHGTIERTGNILLKEGRYPITIDYHNQEGGSWLEVSYRGPGVPKQIVPADLLFLAP